MTQWMAALVSQLDAMSRNSGFCVYCEHDRHRPIDHFTPRRLVPSKTFSWPNLHLACDICNGNKRDQYSSNLLDPADPTYVFHEHFELKFATGGFALESLQAEMSESVFRLNEPRLMEGRRKRFESLVVEIGEYHRYLQAGNHDVANVKRESIQNPRFRVVFLTILRWFGDPGTRVLLPDPCVEALQAHPEIQDW